MAKLIKSLKGLTRQKTIGKDRGATLSGHVTTTTTTTILPQETDRCARERLPLPLVPAHADAICQLPYYHPHITSKDELTNFMSQYSLQEGYFLLRKSFKDPTSYTITVNHRFGLKHVRVVISNGRFSLKDRSFDTFDEMVQYYSHHEIPNEEHISGVLLRFPIRRPPIEFGEYILVSNKQDNPTTPTPAAPSPYMLAKQDNPTTPTPAATSPYMVAIGKQRSEGDYRPLQSPTARPPAPLPRVVGSTTPRKASLIDQAILTPVELLSTETVAPPVIKNESGDGPEYSKPIATSSATSQNLSTSDTVSSNTIGQPSTNDPNLATLIGPPPSQEGERCDCGLLMREASLPLGWSVHVSQDPDTKAQPFFLSPSNETNWDLPLPVALLLSPEQQDLIRKLGFDSDIKAAGGFQGARLITSSMGCSMKTKGWLGTATTQTKTWVSCDDYESSKSLREAQERKEKSSHGVQSKASESSSERTPNGDLQHPKPVRNEKTTELRKKWQPAKH